jgi:hypothetical protein
MMRKISEILEIKIHSFLPCQNIWHSCGVENEKKKEKSSNQECASAGWKVD